MFYRFICFALLFSLNVDFLPVNAFVGNRCMHNINVCVSIIRTRCVSMPKGLITHTIKHNMRMKCICVRLSIHSAISFGFGFFSFTLIALNINGLSKITRRIVSGKKRTHFYPLVGSSKTNMQSTQIEIRKQRESERKTQQRHEIRKLRIFSRVGCFSLKRILSLDENI